MPYNNQYNQSVAGAVRGYSQQHIDREHAVNDFTTNYEIPSQLESAVMRHPEVHGGSGFAAATVQDLGFEPTMGATSGEGVPRRVKRKSLRWEKDCLQPGYLLQACQQQLSRRKQPERIYKFLIRMMHRSWMPQLQLWQRGCLEESDLGRRRAKGFQAVLCSASRTWTP